LLPEVEEHIGALLGEYPRGKQHLGGDMLRRKMKSNRNIERMPAWPGILLALFDSSFRLIEVSHPQKKNNPRADPTATPSYPWMESGLSHAQ
jgi:hypothetical protein